MPHQGTELTFFGKLIPLGKSTIFGNMIKASFEVENVFFMDSSFVPKADYFKKLKSVGANLFQVPFAEQPEMSRIMIDSYLEYGKELTDGIYYHWLS